MAIEILFDDAPGEDSEGRLSLWLDQRIGFSLNRRLALYQNLARKLRQNEMINRVLLRRAEQAGKFGNRWEARMLRRIERLLTDEGASFAYTLQPFVPDDEFTMLLSGEQADDLPAALDMICDTRTRVAGLAREFRTAWVEPALYVVMAVAALAITARFALPKIEQGLRESGTSSAALTLLLAMSRIGTIPATVAAFAGLVGVFLAIRWSLPRMTGRLRVWLEYIPPWSIYRDMHGYLWICSFLAQCKIGIADVDALENQAQDSRSSWLRARLNTIQGLMVNEGVTLPRAMELSGLNFPSPEIIREIDDIWGDEGDYDTLLAQGKAWVDRIEDRTRTQIKVMRGVTTGAAILLIGLIMLLEIQIGQDSLPQ